MGARIFVGNLAYNTTEEQMRELFGICGTVKYAKIISDRETNQSKGFGFIEFALDEEANQAIASLNGHMLNGRTISVKEAHEKKR